ncbi:MAG: hypothetical protein ACRET5_13010 [Steroidobacteraceae bacterium]
MIDGWWLLRASGTEPKLIIRCEAADEAGLERLRQTLAEHLHACGIELSSDEFPGAVASGRGRLRASKAN